MRGNQQNALSPQMRTKARKAAFNASKSLHEQMEVIEKITKDLTEFTHAGLRTEFKPLDFLEKHHMSPNDWFLNGRILNEENEQVGNFQRWMHIYTDLDSDHKRVFKPSDFNLNEEYRGRGFGSKFFEHTLNVAEDYQFDICHIWAKDTGTYLWADKANWRFEEGYRFTETPAWQAEQANSLWDSFLTNQFKTDLVEKGFLKQEVLDSYDELFYKGSAFSGEEASGKIKSPAQLRNLGRENSWQEGNKENWLGRAILLLDHNEWDGWTDFK